MLSMAADLYTVAASSSLQRHERIGNGAPAARRPRFHIPRECGSAGEDAAPGACDCWFSWVMAKSLMRWEPSPQLRLPALLSTGTSAHRAVGTGAVRLPSFAAGPGHTVGNLGRSRRTAGPAGHARDGHCPASSNSSTAQHPAPARDRGLCVGLLSGSLEGCQTPNPHRLQRRAASGERKSEQGGDGTARPHLAERMMTLASSSFASSSSDVTFLVPGSN